MVVERAIRRVDKRVEIITITRSDLKKGANKLDDDPDVEDKETDEIEALIKRAKQKDAGNVLALVKGARDNFKKDAPEDLVELCREDVKVPVILLGKENAVYSFASAIHQAIKIRSQDGAHGWVVSLLPIRTISEDIKAMHTEYVNSLQALIAA